MAAPTPRGFSAARVVAGIHRAMAFGAPSVAADQATFYMPRTVVNEKPADEQDVPFDPTGAPDYGPVVKIAVPCAYEYVDAQGKIENLGLIVHSRVRVTMLDDDYQQVKGFEFVVIEAQRYSYLKTEPPVALGSVDVWTVHCQADDEG